MKFLPVTALAVLVLLVALDAASTLPTCSDIRRMAPAERKAAADAMGLSEADRERILRYCRIKR